MNEHQESSQGGHVTEAEARQVAEQARETDWHLPSFGKQLFLGDFQLDLISPHPQPDAGARSSAARSSAPGCASSARPR